MGYDHWIDLAVAACDHAGIDYGSVETIATWDQLYCANAVYRIDGRRYLKIFGPSAIRQFHIERSVLRTIESHSAIPAPHIVIEGERTPDPPYLVTTEMAGSTAEEVWDNLSRSEQLAIARELGTITAAIHRLPQDDLAAVERQFGDKSEYIDLERTRRIAEIEATETLSIHQRDSLLNFLQLEAREHLEGLSKLTHFDLAHNHIYLSRETGTWKVAGIIDWAEAMLGPPEWDVVYLWFWTFSRDHEAMRECLQTLYADSRPPDRFARRCLAAVLHTPSMRLLWPYFAERGGRSESIEREATAFHFPPDVFGPPD